MALGEEALHGVMLLKPEPSSSGCPSLYGSMLDEPQEKMGEVWKAS